MIPQEARNSCDKPEEEEFESIRVRWKKEYL